MSDLAGVTPGQGNPWSRLADIAERLDVPPKPLDTRHSIYIRTGRGRYDLFDVIEAALDHIDGKVNNITIRVD